LNVIEAEHLAHGLVRPSGGLTELKLSGRGVKASAESSVRCSA
jgi:hypothetical protein